MPTWTLPDTVLQEGYDEQFPENTVKTSTDMGPGKSRQRSTAAPTPITCNVPLTPAQAVSLESFYKSDCAYGALAFDWKHPRTGAAKSLEFMSPPRISARGAMYIGRLELKVLV